MSVVSLYLQQIAEETDSTKLMILFKKSVLAGHLEDRATLADRIEQDGENSEIQALQATIQATEAKKQQILVEHPEAVSFFTSPFSFEGSKVIQMLRDELQETDAKIEKLKTEITNLETSLQKA